MKEKKDNDERTKARKKELAAGCMLDPGDVLWVSASKNINIDRLQDLIRSWLSP